MFLLLTTFIIASNSKEIYAKTTKKESPQNVEVARYKNRELKLTWKKVKGAKGYRIYRYNNKNKKYETIQTIYGKNTTSYIDKNLKFHQVYKYKVASFEMKKGKKEFSKRSYWVSARTYGKKAKLVNGDICILRFTDKEDKEVADVDGDTIEIGICNEVIVKTINEQI